MRTVGTFLPCHLSTPRFIQKSLRRLKHIAQAAGQPGLRRSHGNLSIGLGDFIGRDRQDRDVIHLFVNGDEITTSSV
jgi:hypothetical protein